MPTRLLNSYSDRALSYAKGVVCGDIPAAEYVVKACKRQIEDLDTPPAGFHFDAAAGDRACAFVELCPHIKGELAREGKLIALEDWQCFILSTVFGWVDGDGRRRFRKVYIEVPRGNGKSAISSTVGLYMLALDGEAGAEVYSAATTRDQARIVFRDAQAMARKMPAFTKRFGVRVTAQAIVQDKTDSAFKALSAEGHTLDGLNIHLAVIDELHAHKRRDVYDVVETGVGKRKQSLLWVITTAGSNKHGICYEIRDHVKQVLDGAEGVDAVSQFGIIYGIDKDDDPYEEQSLIKANPNWGVSVDPSSVMQNAGKAKRTATARPNYLTKHLNVWVDANEAIYDSEAWRACEDKSLEESDFEQDHCVMGCDLASTKDFAARVNVYRRRISGRDHYYVFPRLYLSEGEVEDSANPMLKPWQMAGDLISHSGDTNDLQAIEDEIKIEAPGLNLQAVVVDKYQAAQLAGNLRREGIPAVEYPQTTATLSEPTKLLDALMRERRIHHPGNPVLTWMVGNVTGYLDAKDNVFPRKELPQNKIDGAIAMIMGIGWFVRESPEEPVDLSDWLGAGMKVI